MVFARQGDSRVCALHRCVERRPGTSTPNNHRIHDVDADRGQFSQQIVQQWPPAPGVLIADDHDLVGMIQRMTCEMRGHRFVVTQRQVDPRDRSDATAPS